MSTQGLTLTERRKLATQLEIAHAAAELFVARGTDGTTAEAIARRAGVGLRTFYRYFRAKQDAVGPLLAVGGQRWRALLAATDPAVALPDALRAAVREALAAPDEAAADGLRQTRGLLRAAAGDPALRAVWYRVNQESEELLRPLVAERVGVGPGPLQVRLAAAAATAAIRIALETWSETDADVTGPGSPADLAARCLDRLMGPGW
ncbi:TetR family transcriptional regulator [Streptomyces sp. KN37]|uniref:TetR family transcriptional regulator n=1 Tax=Streptomyces sp. KN37 TaxID=3090667 RepID=UPI002A74FFA4|nr:TetR family transcriptional regulator [Streptomyces sp. KN37]WPO74246.1 TetR family transcriptional regulator [Streptomyces sp. KN37]